jgi:FtsP/CotA-like multicopper oxidase with cupredoxin domain
MGSPCIRTSVCLSLLGAVAFAQAPLYVTLTAAPGTATLAPGVTETAWMYNGTLPGPVLRVRQGQQLRVRFENQLPQQTTVHFHGQPLPLGMDGMSGISRPATAPGQEYLYEFDTLVPGTYWFHPHSDMYMEQLDYGLYGVLIVDPLNTAGEPAFDVEQVVVLDDWVQPFGAGFSGHLLNGKSSAGQVPIAVSAGQRLRLRFVNAAATTNYMIALDGHPMTVTHADGNLIAPLSVQALPIGIGERYDVIVDCNNPGTWSLAVARLQARTATVVRGVVQYAGHGGPLPSPTLVPQNLATGAALSYSQLSSWAPGPIGAPNRTYPASLGMTMGGPGMMTFTINGQAFPNVTPMPVGQGEVVRVDMASAMSGNMMYHPMHLHGHSFRLLGTAGGTTHAPLKDTVLVRPMGQPDDSVSVQFTADNPGRWMFHCHDQMHMMNGMIALFDYTGDADADGIPDVVDMDPTAARPVLTIADHEGAFAPGATGSVSAQWVAGELVDFLGGLLEANPPIAVPPFGTLYLQPWTFSFVGSAPVQANGYAALQYTLPPDPSLSGLRLSLQGLGTRGPASVLSTYQAFSIR